MKNDALLAALHKGPSQPKSNVQSSAATGYASGEMPRVLQFHSSEVPNLGNVKTGDQLTLKVHGHIQTMHDDGRAVMHVHEVKPDDLVEKPPEKSPIVRLEHSPA